MQIARVGAFLCWLCFHPCWGGISRREELDERFLVYNAMPVDVPIFVKTRGGIVIG